MAKCSLCNNKIGIFEGDYCNKCKHELYDIILPHYLALTTKEEMQQRKEEIVEDFKSKNMNYSAIEAILHARGKEILEKNRIEREKNLYNYNVQSQITTTGFNFEGYKITKYLGMVGGDIVIGTGMFSGMAASLASSLGSSSPEYSNIMKLAKQDALKTLIHNSATLGGNATIGISYSIVTFSSDLIGVSVNGTSVYVEKISEV